MILFFFNMTFADVGRPPKCPKGTYRTYLQGYRCVPDGHQVVLKDGEIVTIKTPTAELKTAETKTNTKTVETKNNTKTEIKAKSTPENQQTGCAYNYRSKTFGFSFLMSCLLLLGRSRSQT